MRLITEHKPLLAFLAEQLQMSEPQVVLTRGAVSISNGILEGLASEGRHSENALNKGEVISLLIDAIAPAGETMRASERHVWFLAQFYDQMLEGEHNITIDEATFILANVLSLRPDYLRLVRRGDRRYLVSSRRFEAEFGFRVRVRSRAQERLELRDRQQEALGHAMDCILETGA